VGEAGERALERCVDPVPVALERGRVEPLAQADQPRALGRPPGAEISVHERA
jgi:hypothetical protein